MTNPALSTTAAICLIAFTCNGQAQERTTKIDPFISYRSIAQVSVMTCQTMLRIAILKQNAGDAPGEDGDYRGCIEKNKAETKKELTTALQAIKRKPKAQDALKSFHVAFLAAIEGVDPGINETKVSYDKRQQELAGKMTEAWARLEVEK